MNLYEVGYRIGYRVGLALAETVLVPVLWLAWRTPLRPRLEDWARRS